MKKMIGILLVAVTIISTSAPAFAFDRAPEIAVDAVLARPLGIAAIIVGSVFFVVSLPFALTSGSVEPVARTLVVAPFKFTFTRPVGDFSSWDGVYYADP